MVECSFTNLVVVGSDPVAVRKSNIQLNDVRKKSRKRFYESKDKNEIIVPTESGYLTFENLEKVISIRQWKKDATLIVGDSILAGIEEKHIPEIGALKFAFCFVQQLTICSTT